MKQNLLFKIEDEKQLINLFNFCISKSYSVVVNPGSKLLIKKEKPNLIQKILNILPKR